MQSSKPYLWFYPIRARVKIRKLQVADRAQAFIHAREASMGGDLALP
jgi:hypothetical protein